MSKFWKKPKRSREEAKGEVRNLALEQAIGDFMAKCKELGYEIESVTLAGGYTVRVIGDAPREREL